MQLSLRFVAVDSDVDQPTRSEKFAQSVGFSVPRDHHNLKAKQTTTITPPPTTTATSPTATSHPLTTTTSPKATKQQQQQ